MARRAAAEIFRLESSGDELCFRLAREAVDTASCLVMNLIRVTDPELFILGGGLMSGDWMTGRMRGSMHAATIRGLRPGHGGSGEERGEGLGMTITIARTEREFDEAAAWRIIAQMLAKRDSAIGLSTGKTTGNMHAIVSEIYRSHPFDTGGITLFNVDELVNLPRSYAGSCYAMIKVQLCDPLDIPEGNFVMPPTMSEDFEAECAKFEAELERRGGADLQILGLGANGHIGINQPGIPFGQRTWVSPMDPDFEERVRRETGVAADYPLGGLTRGIVKIMRTRRIVRVAKGRAKAEIVKRVLTGPVSPEIPGSVIRLHPACDVLLDAEAASLL